MPNASTDNSTAAPVAAEPGPDAVSFTRGNELADLRRAIAHLVGKSGRSSIADDLRRWYRS